MRNAVTQKMAKIFVFFMANLSTCIRYAYGPKPCDDGHEARRLQPRRPASARCRASLGGSAFITSSESKPVTGQGPACEARRCKKCDQPKEPRKPRALGGGEVDPHRRGGEHEK